MSNSVSSIVKRALAGERFSLHFETLGEAKAALLRLGRAITYARTVKAPGADGVWIKLQGNVVEIGQPPRNVDDDEFPGLRYVVQHTTDAS